MYTGEVDAGGAGEEGLGELEPAGLEEVGTGAGTRVEEAGTGAGLELCTTALVPGTGVGTTQPPVQVTTEVRVRVLVCVTGVLMTDEPLVIVVQVTSEVSRAVRSFRFSTYLGKWWW